MTYASIAQFRLQSITKLVTTDPSFYDAAAPQKGLSFKDQPVSYGLGLEVKCGEHDGKDTYCVIAFLKPTKDGDVDMTTVGNRFFKEVKTVDDLEAVAFLYSYARKLISRALDELESNE